ncbi:hypothetical protein AB0M22_09425 [Nocardia sp. NPDC051756]|uniref:hypothetical protein n=1 Tax=Nocardia sp. NPDC051756 TaxID=3154751 RepID=UPI0034327550
MDKTDRTVTENVLRQMSVAGVNLDDLATAVSLTPRALTRRLTVGSFKVRELGLIAHALDCRTAELLASNEGAAA